MVWRICLLILFLAGLIFLAGKVKRSKTANQTTKYLFYFLCIFGGGFLFYFLFIILFFGANF